MTEGLRDGSCVVIRPIEPDDRAALAEGFERLSQSRATGGSSGRSRN